MKELELEKVIMYKRQPVKTDKEEMDQFKFWFDPSEDSNESWTFRTVQWKLNESLRQATQKKKHYDAPYLHDESSKRLESGHGWNY